MQKWGTKWYQKWVGRTLVLYNLLREMLVHFYISLRGAYKRIRIPRMRDDPPTQEQMLQEQRLVAVASKYLNGVPAGLIAVQLGISKPRINYMIRVLQERWRHSSLMDMADARMKELARIDEVERLAYSEYMRSKKPFTKHVRVSRQAGVDKDGNVLVDANGKEMVVSEFRDETYTNAGDPRYLQIIMDCIGQRCRIFGLYAPLRIDWREQAKQDGYDPDTLYTGIENALFTALVQAARVGSVPGSDSAVEGRDRTATSEDGG